MNPGDTLGPYEIKEPLGAGGMGEVYLAEDTRLGRKVAIKVLPAEFASDPERLARFEQEARAAAALNHPHIAAVFDVGFEATTRRDAGGQDGGAAPAEGAEDGGAEPAAGVHFIVQEYLEGQTLRQALSKRALPLHQALALAAEIGEALDAAHAASIVHRDLKPDNILITESGHAKVLDFGLAKLTEPLAGGGAQMSMSPTALGTVAGQVMGTAGYMAPEQVNGEEVDRRTDVFAFGCILYEMVTGKRAFGGETVVDTLHAVMRTEPISLRELNEQLPAELQRIQNKCLAKDPARRYQHVADLVVDLNALRIEIEAGTPAADATPAVLEAPPAALEAPSTTGVGAVTASAQDSKAVGTPARAAGAAAPAAGPGRWSRWPVPAVLAWALAATAYAIFTSLPEPEVQPIVARFALSLDELRMFEGLGTVAISPDDTKLVYLLGGPAGIRLWVRDIDGLEGRPIPGTAGAYMPFFSPDSRSLGFVVGTQLRTVDIEAGTGADVIAEIDPDALRGAAWGEDGTIVVGRLDNAGNGGLQRLNITTGEFEDLTATQERLESHRFPQFLPDGRILFTIETQANSTRSDKDLAVLSLDSGDITILEARGTQARYVASGHLLYVRNDTLVAQPFDVDRLDATGSESVVLRNLAVDADTGSGQFAVSDNGVLLYQTASGTETRLALVDRAGEIELLHDDPKTMRIPRISPDGRRISVSIIDNQIEDIWMYELERRTFDRFTTVGGPVDAEWSPDGERILYQSNHTGIWAGWIQSADRVGQAELIDLGDISIYDGMVWHPNGRTLAFGVPPGDIWTYTLGEGKPEPFTDTNFIEGLAAFSPDGNWIAFASEEQGREQVYVTEFPGPGRRWVASIDGGDEPKWSRDGSELFYRRGNDMMAVPFDAAADPPVGRPEQLFSLSTPVGPWNIPNYDVAPDGRFVMPVADQDVEPPQLVIVLNWFEELRERAPVRR